jgi:hypothetical protein
MSALPPKTDMCAATRDVCYGPKADIRQKSLFDTPEGYFQKFVSPAVDHFSFGTRYVSWQPSHAKATALNWLRNASPSDALVVDNFSASTCNFLAFSLKSSHCCQTTGFAAVGACVLPGGNCDAIFPDASLIARVSRYTIQFLIGSEPFTYRKQTIPHVRHQFHSLAYNACCVLMALVSEGHGPRKCNCQYGD